MTLPISDHSQLFWQQSQHWIQKWSMQPSLLLFIIAILKLALDKSPAGMGTQALLPLWIPVEIWDKWKSTTSWFLLTGLMRY
jgi:hypothetical protein